MAVSSGVAMDIHYCMGKVTNIDFSVNEKGSCPKCGMKHKKGCCGEEQKFYKLSDSHKNTTNDISYKTISFADLISYPVNIKDLYEYISASSTLSYSPPNPLQRPARILYGVFRI